MSEAAHNLSPGIEPRPSRRWTRAVTFVAAVAVSAVMIVAAQRFKRPPPPEETPAPGMTVGTDTITLTPDAPQWHVLGLREARTAETRWTDPVPARIQVDEGRISRVGAPIAGRVSQVLVQLGQSVKAGAPLFVMTSPDIAELRADKEKAAVDLKASKANLDRVKGLVAAKAAPAKDEVEAQQDYSQDEVAYNLAVAKLNTLRVVPNSANEFQVLAPRDGVITARNVSVGQQVAADGTELVELSDLSSVWVVADLFEGDATQVKEGTTAEVTSPSLPSANIDGTVERVASIVDPIRHTIPVRVRVDNPDGALRPNVYAEAAFQAQASPGAVEVAASAVISDGTHSYVYVEDGHGKFTRRQVTAGSVHNGTVLVLDGLKPGETVVEEGAILLDNQLQLSN